MELRNVAIWGRGVSAGQALILFVGGFRLLESVVRGPHQRPRFDVLESHRFAADFEFRKFIGMHVTNDGQMRLRGLEILPQGENVGALRR